MKVKRKRHQLNYLNTVFALGKVKTKKGKGVIKTMLQKKTEYWQEVRSE